MAQSGAEATVDADLLKSFVYGTLPATGTHGGGQSSFAPRVKKLNSVRTPVQFWNFVSDFAQPIHPPWADALKIHAHNEAESIDQLPNTDMSLPSMHYILRWALDDIVDWNQVADARRKSVPEPLPVVSDDQQTLTVADVHQNNDTNGIDQDHVCTGSSSIKPLAYNSRPRRTRPQSSTKSRNHILRSSTGAGTNNSSTTRQGAQSDADEVRREYMNMTASSAPKLSDRSGTACQGLVVEARLSYCHRISRSKDFCSLDPMMLTDNAELRIVDDYQVSHRC
eukprot:Lankesteria_metandrocarpae@DN2271_c1_g1_i2.p1